MVACVSDMKGQARSSQGKPCVAQHIPGYRKHLVCDPFVEKGFEPLRSEHMSTPHREKPGPRVEKFIGKTVML